MELIRTSVILKGAVTAAAPHSSLLLNRRAAAGGLFTLRFSSKGKVGISLQFSVLRAHSWLFVLFKLCYCQNACDYERVRKEDHFVVIALTIMNV